MVKGERVVFVCCKLFWTRYILVLTRVFVFVLRFSGGGMGILIGASIGWFVGAKIHCKRLAKKLNTKHKQDQKQLYTQYYNDVYTLQEQNAELLKALEQMGVKIR